MTDWGSLTPPPPPRARLDAMRATLLAEAARPRRTWRRGVLWLLLATTGLAGLVAAGAGAAGEVAAGVLAARWLTLLLVGATGPLAVYAALRPGGAPWRWASAATALAGAAALVATRPPHAMAPHASPEWVCTASHLAVAVPAIIVAGVLLRGFARSLSRALAAGIAVGTTGALLGELLCGGAAAHIALFHLGAWLLVTVVVSLVSLSLSRRSYAP
jgi:hypothetical protein